MKKFEFNANDFEPVNINQFQAHDFEPEQELAASQQLINQSKLQSQQQNYRTPQIQEEFSNPTQYPGFEKLSPEEQKKRIAFSAFDPANVSPTGGIVPPGTYESNPARMVASIGPSMVMPEFKFANPLINGIGNMLSRFVTGTAGNVAYDLPNIKNEKDFINSVRNAGQLNALFELPIVTSRLARYGNQFYKPGIETGLEKMNQIKNEASAAKALQQETYKPVFDRYGKDWVTANPENYLSELGINKRGLYPESKVRYENFLNEPSFQHLHEFQSQLGQDAALASRSQKPAKAQRFRQHRNKLTSSATKFLSRDKNALNQYEKGSQITKNLVEPYSATNELSKISQGIKNDVLPHEIENAINQGREKIIYLDKKGNPVTAIPSSHPLIGHGQDIRNKLMRANALQRLVPDIVQKNLLNPVPLFEHYLGGKSPAYLFGARSLATGAPQEAVNSLTNQ